MSGKRFVGLSSRQSVPRLLSVIGNKSTGDTMKPVAVDAPPLSSSDLSDNEGPSSRGDIQPSRFFRSRKERPPSGREANDGRGDRDATTLASRWKQTRTSARRASARGPRSSLEGTGRRTDAAETDDATSPPPRKKLKSSPPVDEELGSQFADDIFSRSQRKPEVRRYGATKTFRSKVRRDSPLTRTFKPPPKDLTPEAGSPERPRKFRMPSSPQKSGDDPASPVRQFKAVPDSDFDSTGDASPVRHKRLKMPEDESFGASEESQRPVFKMPDELPDSFVGDEHGKLDPTAATSPARAPEAPDAGELSSSTLSELESPDETPVCPLCSKEVDGQLLEDFKKQHPRMTVSQMQKFCHQHRKKSAQEAWQERGYPDIEWHRLDARIAQRYGFLRGILEGARQSYYGDLFRDAVRSGQNRTLLRSDANLTPGYYGIRGLRAMSENLIGEFSSLLRRRAVQDRLVSARGHTAYLQSVLVPELAVQLIMEDMGVGEEEARTILKESSWVGELLNDEIADVVLEDSDSDESES